jgi:biotin transporter BioY
MTAVATTFFYGILWLTITLISPNENHFAPILTALIITGYIPATILALLGYKPNRQGEETNNVINNDNEISND